MLAAPLGGTIVTPPQAVIDHSGCRDSGTRHILNRWKTNHSPTATTTCSPYAVKSSTSSETMRFTLLQSTGRHATQAAATAGAHAAQAAAMVGTWNTMAAGFVALVLGMFVGTYLKR